MKHLLLIFISLALMACEVVQIKPLSESRLINNHSAKNMIITVPKDYELKIFSTHTHYLPAGQYLPIFENSNGVFFQAPKQIINTDLMGGTTLFNGGLYLDKQGNIYDYISSVNGNVTYNLPADFKYSIKKR